MFKKLIVFLALFLFATATVFGAFTAVNVGPTTDFAGDINIPTGKLYYINGTQLAFGDVTNALGVTMANVGSTAINASLIADSADDTDLGSGTYEWRALYIGTAGKIYMGLSQEVTLEVTDANTLAITASSNVDFSGGLDVTAGIIVGSNIVSDAADTDNLGSTGAEWKEIYISDAGHLYLGSSQDTNLQRTASNVLTITASSGVILSAGLTVGSSIISDAADTDNLGSAAVEWKEVYISDAGHLYLGSGQDTNIARSAANTMTLTASTAVLLTGDLGITGTRVNKGWFTDIESDNMPTVGGTAIDATFAPLGNYALHLMDVDAADVDYVHAAIVGDGTSQNITTAITNPDFGRNITVTSTAGSVGVVTITGTTADGTTSATDAITIVDGGTAQGVKAFTYVSNINVSDALISPEEVTIGIGDVIGLHNPISAEADIYMKTVDGTEEYGEISGKANTTYNTLDCSTIVQNEDITIYYHP